jgi:hypothetical protein
MGRLDGWKNLGGFGKVIARGSSLSGWPLPAIHSFHPARPGWMPLLSVADGANSHIVPDADDDRD